MQGRRQRQATHSILHQPTTSAQQTHPRLGDPPQSLLLVVLVADSVKDTSRVTPRRGAPPPPV